MNDNDRETLADGLAVSDAHGRAALLLVESLIHGLCENATLRTDQAVEIVERAVAVQVEQLEEADGDVAPHWQSHALLTAIAASLRIDDKDRPPPHLAR